MAAHYSSQHDSVESVTSAYIAVALLAAGIIALSYTLPAVVGANLLVVGAGARAKASSRGDRRSLLGAGPSKRPVSSDRPECCPR